MTTPIAEPLLVNGWTIYQHPLFADQLEKLTATVEELKAKDPVGYEKKNATKRLAAINQLAFKTIPIDPASPDYRLGKTLGNDYKHWFRATFFQQYRLFFRFDSTSKIIIYAWVNDENTKRAYESENDAYKVFKKMLSQQRPPDDWNVLSAEAKNRSATNLDLARQLAEVEQIGSEDSELLSKVKD